MHFMEHDKTSNNSYNNNNNINNNFPFPKYSDFLILMYHIVHSFVLHLFVDLVFLVGEYVQALYCSFANLDQSDQNLDQET